DVGLVALGHLADGFAGGGVDGGKGLAGDAVEPLAADEQRLVLDLGGLDGTAASLGSGCGSHADGLHREPGDWGKGGGCGELSHQRGHAVKEADAIYAA